MMPFKDHKNTDQDAVAIQERSTANENYEYAGGPV